MRKIPIVLVSVLFAVAAFSAEFIVVHELQDAHKSADDALRHLDAANANHKGQFGGHEGKGTELLKQARAEIEQADKFFKEHQH